MSREKLPAYQWYPGDWRKDPAVQSLDYEARGIWRECLDFMHETSDRGWLVFEDGSAMGDADIARMLGIDEAKWKQTRSTFERRRICEIRKDGAVGNRRMAKDEAIRRARAEAGRAGGRKSRPAPSEPTDASKTQAKHEAKRGSSVSSSSSVSPSTTKEAADAPELSTAEDVGSNGTMAANELLAYWIKQQRDPVPEAQKRKQGAAASRLCKTYTRSQITQAAVGIEHLFPHNAKGGQPWDLFDLEKKFAKAMSAAHQHPDAKIHNDVAELTAYLENRHAD